MRMPPDPILGPIYNVSSDNATEEETQPIPAIGNVTEYAPHKEHSERHTMALEAENDVLRNALQRNEEVIASLEKCLSITATLCVFNIVVLVAIIVAVLWAG